MALDGIYLHSIVQELRTLLLNCKVDKVNQPEKNEIILSIRASGGTLKLLISSSSVYPKIHLSTINKPNPITAPLFCMVLRKYLSNAKIIDIRQVSTDRVIIMDFQNTDEFGFNSMYSLIIEIMGRHSNITLIRQMDNVIMDSIKHVTPDINTFRILYAGIHFVYPPVSLKLSPFTYTLENLSEFLTENSIDFDDRFFSNVFTGIAKQLSTEIFFRVENSHINFNISNLKEIDIFIRTIFKVIKENNFHFSSYSIDGNIKDFYCVNLSNLMEMEQKIYLSPSKLLEDYYFEKDKNERLNLNSSDLHKLISTNLDRCKKKLSILNNLMRECTEKDIFKVKGELLTSNIYKLKKGDTHITLLNFYSEKEEYIDITLVINKTPSENIQNYFKKYTKLKRSEEMTKIQLKNTKEEIEYLQSVLTNINNAENYDEIKEMRTELMESGYIKFKKEKQKQRLSKPLHYKSSDGIDIFVGKNNLQNDYLTTKFADKHDTWLHTKDIPGSHVIIKNFGEIPDITLAEAANLSAYYSKAKDSSKVAVDYTEVKNVKKPSGAKPGMVIYYTNKTIYVTPSKPELEKI